MSSKDPAHALIKEARDLSDDDFERMVEQDRKRPAEFVSIEDLAAELNISVRTLRRRNTRPDAPQRFRRSRRLMYRRSDVQHWFDSAHRRAR
jgi:transcriptional regulator GlxA family with amidase domain